MEQQYCPLCQKKGQTKKIKQMQINENESVILCQEPKCPWPFGYEKLKIIPRDYKSMKKIQKRKEKKKNTIEIDKLILYTPPVTPNEDNTSSEIDTIKLLTSSQNYSAEINNFDKEYDKKSLLSCKKNKSIFDIDDTTNVPIKKLNKSNNCDNIDLSSSRSNNLVYKNDNIKSSKNGIQIREIKHQKINITKPINGQNVFVFKQENKSNELINNTTEINYENKINLTDNLEPKNNNTINENIINSNDCILPQLNSNLLETNHDIDDDFDIDEICQCIDTPPTDLPLDNLTVNNEFNITNNNSNNLSENLNNNTDNNFFSDGIIDFSDMTSDEFSQTKSDQTNNTDFDWLNLIEFN